MNTELTKPTLYVTPKQLYPISILLLCLFIFFSFSDWLCLQYWLNDMTDLMIFLAYVMSINHLICTGQNFLSWKLGLAYHSISITFEIWDKWSSSSNQRTLSQILMTLKALAHYTRNCKKIQLSSIHTTTIFHNCNDFFHSFLYEQRFSHRLF